MEEAVSPVFYSCERDLLGAEIARRIWASYGGQPLSDARHQGTLLMLEALVDRHLSESVIRASLALRYLENLEESLCRADYEDARLLLEEARWAETYIDKEMGCALLGNAGHEDSPEEPRGNASGRKERLRMALVKVAADELRKAGTAA